MMVDFIQREVVRDGVNKRLSTQIQLSYQFFCFVSDIDYTKHLFLGCWSIGHFQEIMRNLSSILNGSP